MHDPNQSESHAGVIKAREYEPDDVFEFGGQKLLLKGTSGPPRERSRTAEGSRSGTMSRLPTRQFRASDLRRQPGGKSHR